MQTLSITYSDDLLISTGKSKKAFEQEMRFLLAVKLFELGRMEIPVINLDDDQILDELQNA